MAAGQLRVYFGAAPGVGKTYKMLEEGHRRLERGTDVVVGFIETHGRKHTEELIEGFEVVPRAKVSYRAPLWRRWISQPSWPDDPRSLSWTSWLTPTPPAHPTRSAGKT